jgi:hypothetical protein
MAVGKLLSLNNKLGWKNLPVTNNVADNENS